MKVLQVIPALGRSDGGPSRSVQGLSAGLAAAGVEVWLATLMHGDEPWVGGIEHFLNGVSFSEAVEKCGPDIVHIHGIWSPILHAVCAECRRRGIRYVISPRGMLEPWSLRQKWLKKRIARWLYQDNDLHKAAALHATAESEAVQFKRLGFENPVIVAPNGVNVPETMPEKLRGGEFKRVLYVSRMHPKKGVKELVEAWGFVKSQGGVAGWKCELVYTVNGETERAYEGAVKETVRALGLEEDFIFTGALDDSAKWSAYRRADVFVLPTYSENFGIVVAEALYAGVPVITTTGTPWGELEAEGCGWYIGVGRDALVEALRDACSREAEALAEMGRKGNGLICRKYLWGAIANTVKSAYETIV